MSLQQHQAVSQATMLMKYTIVLPASTLAGPSTRSKQHPPWTFYSNSPFHPTATPTFSTSPYAAFHDHLATRAQVLPWLNRDFRLIMAAVQIHTETGPAGERFMLTGR